MKQSSKDQNQALGGSRRSESRNETSAQERRRIHLGVVALERCAIDGARLRQGSRDQERASVARGQIAEAANEEWMETRQRNRSRSAQLQRTRERGAVMRFNRIEGSDQPVRHQSDWRSRTKANTECSRQSTAACLLKSEYSKCSSHDDAYTAPPCK